MAFNLFDWLAEAGEDAWDFLKNRSYVAARDSAKGYAAEYHLGNDGEAFELATPIAQRNTMR